MVASFLGGLAFLGVSHAPTIQCQPDNVGMAVDYTPPSKIVFNWRLRRERVPGRRATAASPGRTPPSTGVYNPVSNHGNPTPPGQSPRPKHPAGIHSVSSPACLRGRHPDPARPPLLR